MEKYNGKGRHQRILSCVLASLLTFGLVSCGAGDEVPPATESSSTFEEPEDTVPAEDLLVLATGEQADYRIVYPMLTNHLLSDAMSQLKSGLEELSGTRFSTLSDVFAKDEKDGGMEILLGATSYEESKTAMAQLKENTYSVTVSDKRIVIAASNDGLYGEAVKALLAACTLSNGALTLSADFTKTGSATTFAKIAEKGATQYRIVYARSSEEAPAIAEKVQKLIKTATGVTLEIVHDGTSLANYEILVGDTTRKFSQQNAIYFMNYGVLFQKERRTVALTGDLDYAYEKLAGFVESLAKQGELAIPDVLFGSFTVEGYGNIPAFRSERYEQLNHSEYNSFYVLYQNATKEEYLAYIERLEKEEGYTKHQSKEANGSLFATYTNGKEILTVNYIAAYSYVRISVELLNKVSLFDAEEQTYQKVTTPQLTQINGACAFLIRLSDGRFIVLDGGLNREKNVDGLYNQMVAQNVLEGKPVIAAWFLSHPHSDHYGGFIGFSEKYGFQVNVERVVLNLPSYETYSQNTEKAGTTEDIQKTIAKALDVIKVKYAKAGVIIPHAGQELWLADAKVEIAYTHEDLSPSPMKVTNSSSVIIFVNLAGQRIALLADAHDDTSAILAKVYGESLKLDIVQIAHHGYNGGNKSMYQLMNADVALWTSPFETVKAEGLWNNARNNFDMTWVKENLMMSGDGAMIMPLPHTVGSLPDYVRVPSDFSSST